MKIIRTSMVAVSLLSVAMAGSVWAAQEDYSIGGTSAAYLKIPVNARQTGLAGAGVACTQGVEALTINPAGLASLGHPDIQALHGFWVEDIFYDYLSYGQALVKDTAFAVGLTYMNFGAMDKYGINSNDEPVAEGTFTPSVMVFTAGAGQKVLPELSMGVTLKVLSQQIDESQTTAYALDLGALYETPLKGLTLGATLANVGSEIDESPLPLTLQAGAAYQQNVQLIGADVITVSVEGAVPTAAVEAFDVMAAVEYRYAGFLAVRAGYQIDQDAGLGGIDGLSAGLGVQYKMLRIDFGFTSLGTLGEVYQIGLGVAL